MDMVKMVFFQVVVVVYSHLVYVPMASREIAQFSKNMNWPPVEMHYIRQWCSPKEKSGLLLPSRPPTFNNIYIHIIIVSNKSK